MTLIYLMSMGTYSTPVLQEIAKDKSRPEPKLFVANDGNEVVTEDGEGIEQG